MILAIDIGNTNIVIGCFEDKKVIFRERLSTNHTATVLEYVVTIKTAFEMNNINKESVTGSIISSVVPAVTSTVKTAVEKSKGQETDLYKLLNKVGTNVGIKLESLL